MNFNGILLVDKPTGCTSHDVIREIRHSLQMKAVGHAGTLDPLATGLLVILLGEATCLSNEFLNKDKSYLVKVRLGVETDTWDRDGQIKRENNSPLDMNWVLSETKKLVGDIELPVPIYSAVKRGGKKLYEYAREGKDIPLPKRVMSFYDLNVFLEDPSPDTLSTREDPLSQEKNFIYAKISCAKGGFIRSWANQLGSILGVGACVEELRRLSSSPYDVAQAIPLSQVNPESLHSPHFTPLNDCFDSYQTITISGRNERLMINGQVPTEVTQRLTYQQKQANLLGCSYPIKVMSGLNGQILSLLDICPFKEPKIRKVFNAKHKST